MKKFGAIIFVFFVGISCINANYQKAIVNNKVTNLLNVRVRNNTSCDVVAKLKQNDVVEVVEIKDNWATIVLPEDALVFINTALLNGDIIKSDANLRAGAGINHQSYGIVPGNTKITIVKTLSNGWTQIKPLTTMQAYVASQYLTIMKDGDKKPEVTKNVVKTPEVKTTTTQVAKVDNKVSKGDDKIIAHKLTPSDEYKALYTPLENNFVQDSKENVKIVGKLVRTKTDDDNPIQFGLVDRESKKTFYVIAEIPNFYEQKVVTINGTSYSVNNWENKIIIADDIQINP